MKQSKPWLMLAGAALVLAACGGGGSGDDGATPPVQADPLDGVPGEATQSVSGWIDYVSRLIQAQDADGREPVSLSLTAPLVLPTDDASEPASP